MSTTFRKTAKGIAEIETRAHRLPPRTRSLLILVDGKRNAAELAKLAPQQCDETLATLLEQGFIEPAPDVAPPRPPPAPAPVPAAAAAAAAATPAAAPDGDFEARRRAVVRALNDALGPAAETLAIRLERARSPEELEPLVAQAVQLVGTFRGRGAGEAFAARLASGG